MVCVCMSVRGRGKGERARRTFVASIVLKGLRSLYYRTVGIDTQTDGGDSPSRHTIYVQY